MVVLFSTVLPSARLRGRDNRTARRTQITGSHNAATSG